MKAYSNETSRKFMWGVTAIARLKKKGEYEYTKMSLIFTRQEDRYTAQDMFILFRGDELGEKDMQSVYRLYSGKDLVATFDTAYNGVSSYYGDIFESMLKDIRKFDIVLYNTELDEFAQSILSWTHDITYYNNLMDKYKPTKKSKLIFEKWEGIL